MLKGFFLYYLFSILTGNPLLALILLIIVYILIDKTYLGFLPEIFTPFKRSRRIKYLLSELEVNPANADAAQELGTLYFEKKQYAESLKYLKRATEKVNNSPRLYMYEGMSFMEVGQQERGKEALDNAVKLDRKVGHGLPYIYLLQYELNRPGINLQVVRDLESELSKFASTENFYRMGMVYKRAGNSDDAREMFRQAVQEYAYVPKSFRRLHRKWAILSWIRTIF